MLCIGTQLGPRRGGRYPTNFTGKITTGTGSRSARSGPHPLTDFCSRFKTLSEFRIGFQFSAGSRPHTVNPRTITVDKNPAYPRAAAEMKRDGRAVALLRGCGSASI